MQKSLIAMEDSDKLAEVDYEPPDFTEGTDYYSKFRMSFVENERILNEIQELATDNQQVIN